MDKKSLESFVILAKEKSFSRTAEKLNITQPAISKRIANLEAEFNTLLIDRIGKQISLTHSGTVLLEHAKQLLQSMHDCQTAINNTHTQVEGLLKLGVSHHIGLHRLPPLLKSFTQQFPLVELNIQFVDSEQAYQMISNGELELALATLSPQPKDDIQQQSIWPDPLSFVVSCNHPLAQRDSITLNELSSHPAILPSSNTYTGQLIEQVFKQQNCPLHTHAQTNYLETIRMMVSIGLGWSVLPKTMLNHDLHDLQLKRPPLSRDLGLLLHQKRTLSNASQAFIKHIQKDESHLTMR